MLGKLNLTQLLSPHGDRYNGNICSYFKEFSSVHRYHADIISYNATSREVKPNRENSEIAIKKNDQPFVYPKESDKFYSLAREYSWCSLSKYLIQPPLFGIRDMQFAKDSSSGIIGLKTGLPKTANFLGSAPFLKYSSNIDYIPIKKINFKNEFLDVKADLDRKKIRLVDCEDKCFIYKQKFLYDNQNHALQQGNAQSDIKYGMVKQFGGFSEFISSFEDCFLISCSDISGYDKSYVGIDVQDFRNKGLAVGSCGMYKEDNPLVTHVSYYTLNPVRLLWDGSVISQDHSNSSGQNNTATDNCILHDIIAKDLVLNCFYHVYGRFPIDFSEFKQSYVLGLYSDDKVLGLNFEIDTCDFKEIEVAVYLKYGMVIKETASKVIEHSPGQRFSVDDGIEFLGGTAVYVVDADGYLPRPRVGKLMTSLTRRLNDEPDLSITEQYNKVYSIYELLLCVDSEIKISVCRYLLFLLDKYEHELTLTFGYGDKRVCRSHLLKMSYDDLANAGEILGWETR